MNKIKNQNGKGKAMKTEKAKIEPKTRFNWGYHNAAFDVDCGLVRTLIEAGRQDTKHVSKEWDLYYYQGYRSGLADKQQGCYAGNSDEAWIRFCEYILNAGIFA